MGERGRRRVEERFDKDSHVAELLGIYRAAIDARAAGR
jgi:glycosyltransferase involved in cell wall biosynthesis